MSSRLVIDNARCKASGGRKPTEVCERVQTSAGLRPMLACTLPGQSECHWALAHGSTVVSSHPPLA